jgi:FMN phosphatase YigB (HAD superfamily)
LARIRAITFDLWDTIVHDDPTSQAQGPACAPENRAPPPAGEALNRQAPIAEAEVTLAYNVGDAAFNHVWQTSMSPGRSATGCR